MSEQESPPRDLNISDASDDFNFDIPEAYVENLENGTVENLVSTNLDMQMSDEQIKRIIVPPSMPAQVNKDTMYIGGFCYNFL